MEKLGIHPAQDEWLNAVRQGKKYYGMVQCIHSTASYQNLTREKKNMS